MKKILVNTVGEKDETHVNLRRLDSYLTEEEERWVLNTAPTIVVNNNLVAGTPGCKEYGDDRIHISMKASEPVVDYLVCNQWVRVFKVDKRAKWQRGSWCDYLAKLAVQLTHERDAMERQGIL